MEVIEIQEAESSAAAEEERVYLALGDDFNESANNLKWCLETFRGEKITILHVHVPQIMLPGPLGGKVHYTDLDGIQLSAERKKEEDQLRKTMNQYVEACGNAKTSATMLVHEAENISKAILELIFSKHITKLVMGAARNSRYRSDMMRPTSRKAREVERNLPPWCSIWFVCDRNLICSREAPMLVGTDRFPPSLSPSPSIDSTSSGANSEPGRDQLRSILRVPFRWLSRKSTRSPTHRDNIRRREDSIASSLQSSEWFASTSLTREGGEGQGEGERRVPFPLEDVPEIRELNQMLQQYMKEAEKFKSQAHLEWLKRLEADKHALAEKQRADEAELLLDTEHELRIKETESHNLEVEQLRNEAEEHKLEMEKLLKERDDKITELLSKNAELAHEMELLVASEQEQREKESEGHNLEVERLRKEAEEQKLNLENLLKERDDRISELSRGRVMSRFTEFTLAELETATRNFNSDCTVGEGGFGTVYKGKVRYTEVAIKKLKPESTQGAKEFQQEIEVLTQVRHPNLITLMGACSEKQCLVYEYLENGSLEYCLFSSNSKKHLSWRDRYKIAEEVRLCLLFLHSINLVHGDMKPANILLDSNLKAKISDFGICRFLPKPQLGDRETKCWITVPNGTAMYMDPQYMATGELTTKSDVYAFGVIVLQLLTRKTVIGLVKKVESALADGKLYEILDQDAGRCPAGSSYKLAKLALRCCAIDRRNRPNLEDDEWQVLQDYM